MRTKIFADYHMHTVRCGHAGGTMEEYVEAAIARGLLEVGFSDHIPWYWMPPERRDPESAMAMEELDEYVHDVHRLRERYPEIPIRLGIEADFIPGREEELARLLARYEWDYVIGSCHFIGDWPFDDDRYIAGFQKWDLGQLYDRFWDLEIAAARTGLFDIMAHLDLIKKFGHRPPAGYDLQRAYRRVADAMAEIGVVVELSVAGTRKPVGEYYPHPDLLRLCRERGVDLVISSDAHHPAEVGRGFDAALAVARGAGYDRLVSFERRRRRYHPAP
jgi:histidinol-phosphatase (PHP family)